MSLKSSGLISQIVDSLVQAARRRATISQLSRLSDRELRDIGIHRGEIERVARELVA